MSMTATDSQGPDNSVQFVDASEAFQRLQAIVAPFTNIPALSNQRVLRFRFTVFEPDAGWPPNLNAFPVPSFRDGMPIPPDGNEANPITIAVNSRLGDDEQALAVSVSQYVVATMRRQSAVAEVVAQRAELASLSQGVKALDRTSQSEAIALARAVRAGRGNEVRAAASQLGYGVSAEVVDSWLPDGPTFRSRIPFYERCYNELPIVRDTVDRIVSATVGVGPRVSSASEELRRIVEQWSTEANLAVHAAHVMRDAVLMGVGCLAIQLGNGLPRMRLIRPDRLDLGAGRESDALEDRDGSWVKAEHATVLRGTAQPNSVYGASLLDPYVMTLFTAVDLRATAREIEQRLGAMDVPPTAFAHLQASLATSKNIADNAEASLGEYLRPIHDLFPAPRYPLYFRGHELWP
jgi:hypothetical protein